MTATVHLDHVSKIYKRGSRHGTIKEDVLRRRPAPNGGLLHAVDDVSFEIHPGEILGILGDNGCGKSTLLKLIAGITQPTEGTIEVSGTVASLLEVGVGFHPEMTGYENVRLSGALLGIPPQVLEERLPDIVAFAELEEFMDTPVKHYSSGMYLRLGFAVGAFVDPEVILVDEVLAVGDQLFQQKCNDHLRAVRNSGKTIVVVSHDMNVILSLCSRCILMDRGKLIGEGLPIDIISQYRQHLFLKAREMGQRPPSETTMWNRYGDFEARIERIQLLDGAGQPVSVLETGDPLVVELYWSGKKPLRYPTFAFSIIDDDERDVFTTATHFSYLDVETLEGGGVVRFTIDRLDLLEGYYSIQAGLAERPEGPGSAVDFYMGHDFQKGVEPFMVRPKPEDRGLSGAIKLPCRCEILTPEGQIISST